jgi:hypothetical protein
MNSRRLMASPRAEDYIGCENNITFFNRELCRLLRLSGQPPHVRFGSKADIAASPTNVRFTPESGH